MTTRCNELRDLFLRELRSGILREASAAGQQEAQDGHDHCETVERRGQASVQNIELGRFCKLLHILMAEGTNLVIGEMTNISAYGASRPSSVFPYGKPLARLALLFLLLQLSAVQALGAEPKRVLILHSFGRDYSPFAELGSSFRAKLIERAEQPVDLYEASIFKARFEQSDETGLVSYLRDIFTSRAPDVIVTLGFPAANFIRKHRQTIFPGVPVVMGVNHRRVLSWSMEDVVVVSQKIEPQGYIENILRLLPDTKTIAVLIGNSPLENYWRQEGMREFSRFADRVSFIWLNNLSLKQMEEAVAQLPPHSVLLETLVLIDADGVPHPRPKR